MKGFKLKLGDPVVLNDKNAQGDIRGGGYTITAITKNYIECTHKTLAFGQSSKSVYFGKNDLHKIKLDKSA